MRILLADDDDVSRHILRETLTRWGYDVVCASDGAEAWRLLRENDAPRLAILDWIMPGMNGVDVCRNVREHKRDSYIYVILLTAKDRKEDVIKGMGAGADDYVSKPFDPQELRMRLSAGRRIIELQTELLAARESMRYMATHDSLTGMANRAEILDRLRRELDRSSRGKSSLGILIVDIDRFKSVNDTFGHVAGDRVLVEVASKIRSSLRSNDSVGRYGGEEFLIILPASDAESTARRADRLRSAVADAPISLPEGSVRVTLSVGVATFEGGSSVDMNRLIRDADHALYQAKASGRNRIALAQAAAAAGSSLAGIAEAGAATTEGFGEADRLRKSGTA